MHLLDGIFIDDLDASGTDVPEIQFIGTVYAEGAASIAIISVGMRGGCSSSRSTSTWTTDRRLTASCGSRRSSAS